jgi:hypothetical protein
LQQTKSTDIDVKGASLFKFSIAFSHDTSAHSREVGTSWPPKHDCKRDSSRLHLPLRHHRPSQKRHSRPLKSRLPGFCDCAALATQLRGQCSGLTMWSTTKGWAARARKVCNHPLDPRKPLRNKIFNLYRHSVLHLSQAQAGRRIKR